MIVYDQLRWYNPEFHVGLCRSPGVLGGISGAKLMAPQLRAYPMDVLGRSNGE